MVWCFIGLYCHTCWQRVSNGGDTSMEENSFEITQEISVPRLQCVQCNGGSIYRVEV
jgi:ferredoxin